MYLNLITRKGNGTENIAYIKFIRIVKYIKQHILRTYIR